ncbi:RNase HII [Desulfocicer vacuolatum DSM 3385]|uniref:Ribonuclease HII n=1 Tax=Desulfocicer vacuolatum DSM 3385 TaxID=1121400 RepID=A0A1W2CSD0_9BACT|nr:ribonuclease HII [Desulfocicer vacuolatum]SMC88121.1 RNase HII [Desulfocicer vacuolatum DSM 3385]
MWAFEKKALQAGYRSVAGIDEAGRGPLAGPVVSAAVILPPGFTASGVNDSKKLTPRKRDLMFDIIMDQALAVSTGIATVEEIDDVNILKASLLSMLRAANGLCLKPDFLLIDGKFTIESSLPQQAVIKGDSKSISIAAASIIAKVTRDRIMKKLHVQYPQYGFDRHKGYPTALHKKAVMEFGPCPVHRKTFKGVKEFLF